MENSFRNTQKFNCPVIMLMFTKNNGRALLFIILTLLLSVRGLENVDVETTDIDSTITDDASTTDEGSTTDNITDGESTADSTTDSTTEDSMTESVTPESTSQTTQQSDNKLLIHFISDLQYNILPVDSNMGLCQVTSGVISEGCLGGYGRLDTYMSEKKADTDIWLNAGNTLQGSLFRRLKFDPIVEAMNDLQFDVVAAESEMFRYGIEAAEQIYMEGLEDVLVSFNYKNESTKQIQKGGCKIAVVGFVDKEKTDAMGVTDLTLKDELEYITEEVETLKTGDSDIIIVMGSTSKDNALEIASIEGVNLVIYSGADATDFSPDNNYLWNDTQSNNGEKVYIASMKIDGTKPESIFKVGEISLTITDDCKVSEAAFHISDYGKLEISDSLHEKTVTLLEDMQRVVKTPVQLTGADNMCQLGECLLGNLVADAIMSAVSAVEVSLAESPVKFSVFPMWTLFTNITLTDDVSMADLYGIFEDDSYLYSIKLTGKQLKDMFEEAVSNYQSPTVSMENFLQVSNYLHVTYNLQKNSGERVNEIQIFDVSDPREFQTVNFDDTSSYNITFPKFVLEGDHFSFVKSESLSYKFYKITFLDALKDYISWKGSLQNSPIPVIPTVGERIQFYEGTSNPGETCYNNTGEVVIITLVIIAVIAGAGFAGWKFLYPKFKARRGSRTALIM